VKRFVGDAKGQTGGNQLTGSLGARFTVLCWKFNSASLGVSAPSRSTVNTPEPSVLHWANLLSASAERYVPHS
jgi:hypothetical protein